MSDAALPSVTAIVATRDRPELLREALASIVACRYEGELDVVLVFDQSEPDESLAGVHNGRTVTVISNTRSPGLAGARNSGVAAASGELVAFCDDDDSWLPSKLETQVPALLAVPDAWFAVTGVFIRFKGRSTPRVLDADRITLADLVHDRLAEAHPSTFLIRRDALLDAGSGKPADNGNGNGTVDHDWIGPVDEGLPGGYAEDYDLLLRAARVHDIVVVGVPLTVVNWHTSSFFFERWRTIDEALAHLLDKHPEFATDATGLARVEGQQAFAKAAMGDRGGARRQAVQTLRHDWRQPRGWLALVTSTGVVAPDAVLRALQSRGRGI
jgi:glycosyltransferase involved in cell wall biosynthesis